MPDYGASALNSSGAIAVGRTPASAPTFTEIATLANDVTRGLVMAQLPLPPTDMVLAARGGDYRAWDWVMPVSYTHLTLPTIYSV